MKWIPWGALIITAAVSAAPQNSAPTTQTGAQRPGPVPPAPAPASRPAAKTGTARIRGQLLSDVGVPIREADIQLSGEAIREAKTDETGRFEFASLPAGRFYLTATKSGFATPAIIISGTSGSFELTDGQQLDRTMTLARGGVVKGRIVDESGDPVTSAEIRVERFVYGPAGRQLATHTTSAGGWATNDLGEYRVYGLPPGEYVVSARSRQFGAPVTMGPGGRRDRAEGILPTFFPGTTRLTDAQLIRVAAGQEMVANFAAVSGRLRRVSGTVRSATGRSPAGLNVFLAVETSNSSGQINGGSVNADGSFSIGNVPPGDFKLRVREQGAGSAANEVAVLPITVSTTDLTDLELTTHPGTTIRGRVEWEGSAARPTTTMRVSTRSNEPSIFSIGETTFTYSDLERGTVHDDNSFELGGIVGNVLFQLGAASWTMKSVMVDGRDIINTGVDAETLGGDKRVVIVMTDRLSEVSGTVQDTQRRPATDYFVVLLPQEPVAGAAASRFVRVLRPEASGVFRARGMPTGDYVVAAIRTLESGREWDPEIQKLVRANGQRFTLTDGETRSLNLELLR